MDESAKSEVISEQPAKANAEPIKTPTDNADARKALIQDIKAGADLQVIANGLKRPGGELRQTPLEIDEKLYDPFDPPKLYRNPDGSTEYKGGTEINKLDETASEQKEGDIDVSVLKAIFEKCTKEYEGKYKSGLFGANVDLTPTEITALQGLLGRANETFKRFTDNDSVYTKFQQILEERRNKVGRLSEASSIIIDDNAQDVQKVLIEGKIPGIKVPARIQHLYTWENRIGDTGHMLKDYIDGQARGRSTKQFGQDVKDIYRFVKESSTNT